MAQKHRVIGIYSKHSGIFNYEDFLYIKKRFEEVNGLIYLTSFDKRTEHGEVPLETAVEHIIEERPEYVYLRAGDGGRVLSISDILNKCSEREEQEEQKPSLKNWRLRLILDPTGTHDKGAREYQILSLYAFGKRRNNQRMNYLDGIFEDLEREKELETMPMKLIRLILENKSGEKTIYTPDFGAGISVEIILKYLNICKEDITGEKDQNLKFKKPAPVDMLTTFLRIILSLATGEKMFEGTKARFCTEGKDLTKEGYQNFVAFLLSTDELTIPGFKTMYDAKRYRERAHFIATWKYEVEVLPYLGHLAFGWPLGENTIDMAASKLEGEFENEEVVQFSGEFDRAKKFTAEVIRDKVKIVVPHYFQRLYADNLVYELTRMAATNALYPLMRFYYEDKDQRIINLYRLYLEQLLLPRKIRDVVRNISDGF